MASTINATTSSGIVATADNTGSLALQSAGTTIATISSTGLTMNSGNIVQASGAAPAFSAYSTALTSTSTATWTKVTFNTEEFDTNSNFASNRFTPTVAGYYQVNTCISGPSSSTGIIAVNIYKNGASFKIGNAISNITVGTYVVAAALIYCNGSTDYIEVYAIQSTGGTANVGSNSVEFGFSASMVRSA